MTLKEFWSQLNVGGVAGWAVMLLILLFSLIQISPLKLNPWDRILGWIGNKLNGAQLKNLQKQVTELWINNHRQSILTFARECRANVEHDAEEWTNILNLCEEYEQYTRKNEITNGVVRENTKYIRNLYQEISREHRM